MTLAPSQTGIVNAALAHLGSTTRVAAISADSIGVASDAAAIWDSTVRTMLAEHPWNFAIRRAQLNASATAPAFGYAKSFALPADCLRWLPPREDDDESYLAEQEGTDLLTDEAGPLNVRYISSAPADAIGTWPPHFVTAMEWAIAARLAEPVTQSESIKRDAEDRAEAALKRARRRDGQATGRRDRTSVTRGSDWLAARDRPYYPFGGR